MHSASGAGSRGTARPSSRWTTRSRARPSTWAALQQLAEDPGLARHMLESLAHAARLTLHVSAEGRDPHHVAEAAFKAVGRALRDATRESGAELPSTKGVL